MNRAGIIGVAVAGVALLAFAGARMPWPVEPAHITSPYGDRDGDEHHGVDLRAAVGTPVHAPAAGEVVDVWYDADYGGGNSMRVLLVNGLVASFAHLSRWVLSAGDQFAAGAVLALTGETGNARGPHLHYAVKRNGKWIDPATVSA